MDRLRRSVGKSRDYSSESGRRRRKCISHLDIHQICDLIEDAVLVVEDVHQIRVGGIQTEPVAWGKQ
jgi:hypothetical protein